MLTSCLLHFSLPVNGSMKARYSTMTLAILTMMSMAIKIIRRPRKHYAGNELS